MKNALRLANIALIASLALGGAACTPAVDLRGNLPHPDLLAQIKPGKTTRDEVQTLLGSPSTSQNYGEESWQYISSRTETVAFFEPKVMERKVISISFDRNGLVKDMSTRGLDEGLPVTSVDRETPTAGKEMTVLQQLLGNVGRFSKDPAGK